MAPVALPPTIVAMMDTFGRHQFAVGGAALGLDPRHDGLDAPDVWTTIIIPLYSLAEPDPGGFVVALRDAVVPIGGWPVYGASRAVAELVAGDFAHPAHDEIRDAALAFLRERGIPNLFLTGYEWDYWTDGKGRAEPWLQGRPRPALAEAPITDLAPGELRRVAQVLGEPDSNVVFVQRGDQGGYVSIIDSRTSDEDPTRVRREGRRAATLHDLYWEIGRSFQIPTYWCDEELAPYFPLPRPRVGPDSKTPADRGSPAVAAVPVPASGGDWEARVRHFLDADNATAAHRVAEDATRTLPGHAVAWALRGQASALLGNHADAEYELAEASRLDPAAPLPVHLLGEVYAQQQQWKRALAQFDAALSLSPDDPDVLTSKAKVLVAADRPQAAIRLMEPVIRRARTSDRIRTLAAAYHDAALDKLTFVPDHGYLWTSEEHLHVLDQAADRIEGLRSNDPEVGTMARTLRAMAEDGRRLHWDTAAPNLFFWLGGIVFVMVCGACGQATDSVGAGIVFGLLAGAGAGGTLFAVLRHKPAWKIAQEQLGKGNVTQRLVNARARAVGTIYRIIGS